MKVIRHDNYDDEGPRGTQYVVREKMTKEDAEALAEKLNHDPRRSEYDWFRAVPDDYVLFVFEP